MLSREVCRRCHRYGGLENSEKWYCRKPVTYHSLRVTDDSTPLDHCPYKFEHAVFSGLVVKGEADA